MQIFCLAIISRVAINTPTLVRIRKRFTSDVRSKDAPALWAAQKKYENHERGGVRADEEMDVGV